MTGSPLVGPLTSDTFVPDDGQSARRLLRLSRINTDTGDEDDETTWPRQLLTAGLASRRRICVHVLSLRMAMVVPGIILLGVVVLVVSPARTFYKAGVDDEERQFEEALPSKSSRHNQEAVPDFDPQTIVNKDDEQTPDPQNSLACYDGKYEGRDGIKPFFWSFGTSWTWTDKYGGGLMSTPFNRRDLRHHKSVLRSSSFVITPRTRITLFVRGGVGHLKSVNGRIASWGGNTTDRGFLGVALWQLRTQQWAVSKTKNAPNQDHDEKIVFEPADLAPLLGVEISIDILDTFSYYWGWILVRRVEIEGTCTKNRQKVHHYKVTAGSGEECHFSGQEGLQSAFATLGGFPWHWENRLHGGLYSNKEKRDGKHLKTVLRSVPIKVTENLALSILVGGGRGHRHSVDHMPADVGGKSLHHGFLGVAIRKIAGNEWVLSARRTKNSEEPEKISFDYHSIANLRGEMITLDVIDGYHGYWGWISVREFTLHGPCSITQTNAPLHFPDRPHPSTTPVPHQSTSRRDGKCVIKRSQIRPSLYCFSVMSPAEIEILQQQYKRKASIFQCNDFNVISVVPMSFGIDECGNHVYTWHNDVEASTLGDFGKGEATSSFLNTKTFLLAWDTLLAGGKVPRNDWIVKVDPDCVFFPMRLREHLKQYTGTPVLVKNCPLYGGKLFGALEAISEPAVAIYDRHRQECKAVDWRGWGEDLYMENCLLSKGVSSINDFNEVGDDRCRPAACTDDRFAAYHPFKDSDAWWKCWEESPK